jgi:hypothetical protein
MTDKNQQQEKFRVRGSENDTLDRALDAALAKYAAAGPRPGIEERILANLHAESKHSPQSTWRNWNVVWSVAVGIAAMVAVVAALMLRTHTMPAREITIHPVTQTPSVKQPGSQIAEANHALTFSPAPASHSAKELPHSKAVTQASPKLAQFPSPQPQSKEERLLIRYVQKFPEVAVMIARAQTESEIEIEQLISNQPPAQEPEPQQDQQERCVQICENE